MKADFRAAGSEKGAFYENRSVIQLYHIAVLVPCGYDAVVQGGGL